MLAVVATISVEIAHQEDVLLMCTEADTAVLYANCARQENISKPRVNICYQFQLTYVRAPGEKKIDPLRFV
jgi:hypothetical protein